MVLTRAGLEHNYNITTSAMRIIVRPAVDKVPVVACYQTLTSCLWGTILVVPLE